MMELNVTDSPVGSPPPGKEQQAAGVGILLQISMLVLSFVLGHVLRRKKFYYLPEASASLLIGNPSSHLVLWTCVLFLCFLYALEFARFDAGSLKLVLD